MKLLIAVLLALPLVAQPGTGALAQGGEYVELLSNLVYGGLFMRRLCGPR